MKVFSQFFFSFQATQENFDRNEACKRTRENFHFLSNNNNILKKFFFLISCGDLIETEVTVSKRVLRFAKNGRFVRLNNGQKVLREGVEPNKTYNYSINRSKLTPRRRQRAFVLFCLLLIHCNFNKLWWIQMAKTPTQVSETKYLAAM